MRINLQDEVDQARSELENGVEDVLSYIVSDLGKFFDVYEFDKPTRDLIHERWQGEDLTVFQDGSVVWEAGDLLVERAESAIADEDFVTEAREVGAEVLSFA